MMETGMMKPFSTSETEHILLQAVLNNNSLYNSINPRREPLVYNEKELRDAAHAEVANTTHEPVKSSRKPRPTNADEKMKQSRDRNREHAKNTRLRKKAYILKLKELADELIAQKENDEFQRKGISENMYSTSLMYKNAALLFLSYRSDNMRDRSKWESILEENVVLTLPITPFRYFHKNDIKSGFRIVCGIDGIMRDTKSLALMLENLGFGANGWKESILRGLSTKMIYHTSQEDTLAAGSVVMCRYLSRLEVPETVSPMVGYNSLQTAGMLFCQFSPNHKISSIEMVFDVMSFMQQLQRTSGILPEYSIVPNTLEMALQSSNEIRAVIKNQAPFPILHVNLQWTRFTGQAQSDLENVDLSYALGLSENDARRLSQAIQEVSMGMGPVSMILLVGNLVRSGKLVSQQCYLKILPLTSDSENISHLLLSLADLSPSPTTSTNSLQVGIEY